MLHIFDVSGYQGTTLPLPADASFVKATEGATFSSASFSAQWAYAKKNVAVRGAYHFARPEQSSAASQADRLIAAARPVPGEVLWLDLEVSQLSQSATNTWARSFGDRLREKAPGVKTGVYTSGTYASTATGARLADHFDLWWYPQYPSTSPGTWPTAFTPWLPSGLTIGWSTPHIWQFTDNLLGFDASISPLTIDQLAGTASPAVTQEANAWLS